MNIYDPYFTSVTVGSETYDLHTAYDRWLMAIDAEDDPLLMVEDRIDLQARLIIKNPPRKTADKLRVLNAAFGLLPHGEGGEKVIDLHQDAAMIRSAFFRIGIDLAKDKIHIQQFAELLADLPADTALMRVVELRQKPIPKATKYNTDYIAALQRAKAKVAIKVSPEEREKLFMDKLKKSNLMRG